MITPVSNSFGSLREFNPCHDPDTGEFCPTVSAADALGGKLKDTLFHGSPLTLHELQPGSMLSDSPVWGAGYTTKLDSLSDNETFIGKIHTAATPTGRVIYARGVHDAEGMLISMAKNLPQYSPSMRLRDLAELVHKTTGIDAIIARNGKGEIKGAIILKGAKVTGHLDPVEALRHAKTLGREIPSNLETALRRLQR